MANKKIIYGFFVIAFSLAVYSFDGTKSTVLTPLYLSLIFLIYCRSKYLSWLPLIIGIVLTLSLFEFCVVKTNFINEFLTRRIIAVPGYLNTVYWDFFSENNKVLLTDSIGKYFLDPVYDHSTTYLIGLEVLGNVETNANTGIWMGAFAHFGIVGIFVISAVVGFILGLIDNLTKQYNFMLGTLICAYLGITWSEQMLHTSILTGGIFYILLFLLLVRFSKIIRPEQSQAISANYIYAPQGHDHRLRYL